MFQLGVVMQLIGDTQGAMAQYERVLSLSNNHVPALNNLAFLYAEGKGDLTRALQLATRAYLLSPDNGAVNDTIGYVMLKKGETEKALKALKRAEQLVPEDPHVHYHLALAYEEEGDTNRAVESLYQALRLGDFPEKGEARRLLERLQKG
jgi:tetratricopeptide (TPR) repeat protein